MNKKLLITSIISFVLGGLFLSPFLFDKNDEYANVTSSYTNCWQERDDQFPESHWREGGELTYDESLESVNAYRISLNEYTECMNEVFEGHQIYIQ